MRFIDSLPDCKIHPHVATPPPHGQACREHQPDQYENNCSPSISMAIQARRPSGASRDGASGRKKVTADDEQDAVDRRVGDDVPADGDLRSVLVRNATQPMNK